MLGDVRTFLYFFFCLKYSLQVLCEWKDCAAFAITWVSLVLEVKAIWGNPVFFCQQLLLSFAAHFTDIQRCGLKSTGRATWCQSDRVINNGTKQGSHRPGTASPNDMKGAQEPKDTQIMVPPITRATLVYLNQTNSHRPHMHTCRLGGKNILSCIADRDEDQMPKLPRHLGLTVLTLIVEDVNVTYQRRQRNPD